jgi:3-oxoacyl-[acyl-carrier protein] reductase
MTSAGLHLDAKGHIITGSRSGRGGQPDDLAGIVTFLASGASRHATGQILGIDVGMGAS